MKKILAGILIAGMVLSMTACGDSSDSSTAQTSTAETESEEDEVYVPGVWNDNVYTNTSMKISYELPEGWFIGSQEEFEAAMEANDEGSTDDDIVYDTYIYNDQTSTSVMIMAKNAEVVGGVERDEEETAGDMMDTLEAMSGDGVIYEVEDTGLTSIAPKVYFSFRATISYTDTTICQYYMVKSLGDRIVTVVITYNPELDPNAEDNFLDNVKTLTE